MNHLLRRALGGVAVLVMVVAGLVSTTAPASAEEPDWARLAPPTSPSARTGASMAFDSGAGQLVLFGGEDSAFHKLGDTWVRNGDTWTNDSPPTGPSPRAFASTTYDPVSDQLFLFGGQGATGARGSIGALDDLWAWNGGNWYQVVSTHRPPARDGAVMTFDPRSNKVVLFGGVADDGHFLNDTWVWDASGWTQLTPPASPSARTGAVMQYDPVSAQVVLFGGFPVGAAPLLSDTWTWDGATWSRQTPPSSPPARAAASLAYDALKRQVLLFGGVGTSNYLADTWAWDGHTWLRQSPTSSPSARADAAMAFDGNASEVVLFGGDVGRSHPYFGDTWLWGLPRADMSARKTGPSTATPGSNISYTIAVHNGGPWSAAGPTMTDTLPAGETFVSESHPTGWTCTQPAVGRGGLVSCDGPPMAAGVTASFVVTAHVPPTTPAGATLSNTAQASSSTDDENPSNDSSMVSTRVAVDHTVSGPVSGSPTFSGGSWLVSGANITGSVTISSGARVTIVNSTIGGSLVANGADALSLCGSTVGGATSVRGTSGFVLLGDPGDDGCAANQLHSSVTLSSNHGGLELAGVNHVGGSVTVTGTTGTGPFPDDTRAEIEGNVIAGSLSCSGNSPTATNDGHANTVSGSRTGECGASGF